MKYVSRSSLGYILGHCCNMFVQCCCQKFLCKFLKSYSIYNLENTTYSQEVCQCRVRPTNPSIPASSTRPFATISFSFASQTNKYTYIVAIILPFD